jgi:hypothetical protein
MYVHLITVATPPVLLFLFGFLRQACLGLPLPFLFCLTVQDQQFMQPFILLHTFHIFELLEGDLIAQLN